MVLNSDCRQLLKKLLTYPKETEWLEFKVNNKNPIEIAPNSILGMGDRVHELS